MWSYLEGAPFRVQARNQHSVVRGGDDGRVEALPELVGADPVEGDPAREDDDA